MIHLFNLKNQSSNIIIKIDNNKLSINEIILELPMDWKEFKKCFGEPTDIKKNGIYWKELGISTNPYGNGITNHLSLHIDYNPMEVYSKSEQKPFFKGKIIVDGIEINKKKFKNITMRKYEIKQFTYTGKKSPCLVSISYNRIFDKSFIKPKLTKDKYTIRELDEEQIAFSDFGFKLSIIQELMYNKELLEPKFDLSEFIEWYDKRKIDIEKEGYEPIPEVTQYFKDLQIPKKLAAEITEIYQDGGNEIYLNLLRFAEGWENYWDIESSEDAKNFPNLKKVTLCYAKKNIVDELKDIGIDADWI
ncbi:hypothetical protein D1818_19690 [Aquimarina sp. BL5]|uniref:DUF6892 domain-containing protein n=1 Tax=Aquimarina sp. BL5 TaxID=1714860 RepID=UPI000E547C94|nr:hypothetical protein [Aquimarina sp. BL5]AXT52933.1 hypothetical protein D1818_19690 [Aquimarina sp. BL5]RKN10345.1 hypothetical protein D7036_02495 [Aquimarina sp. BL5]